MWKLFLDLRNKLLYKALFLVLLLFMAIPYFNEVLSPFVKIFLLWGGIYICYDLYKGYRFWKDKNLLLLLAFCAAYGISILVNGGAMLVPNIKALAYMVLIFLVFFGQDGRRSRDEVLQELRLLTKIVLGVTFVFALICFGTYLFYIEYVYVVGGTIARIGMKDQRMWGLYNANTCGALCVVAILLTVWMWADAGKSRTRSKWFYGINLILQFTCLSLTASRTSIYAFLAGGALGVFLWQWKNRKRVLICLLVMILALGAGFAGSKVLPKAIKRWPERILNLCDDLFEEEKETAAVKETQAVAENDSNTDNVAEEETLSEAERLEEEQNIRERRRGDGGVLSGRTILWEGGLKAWKEAPLLGVTREGLYDAVTVQMENSDWFPDLKNGGLHNGYLTILVSSGILGTLLMIGFLGNTWRKLLGILWKRKGDTHLLMGITFLLVFAIMETMEARSMYQMNIFFVLLWMYYGYVTYLVEQPDEEMKVQ